MKDQCLDIGMTVCYWCGESKDIVMDTRLKSCDNLKLEQHIFDGYEPCDICKTNMEKGFTIMQVQETPIQEGQPAIQEGLYPTGAWTVIKTLAAEEAFEAKVVEGGMCYMDKETMIHMGLIQETKDET